MSNTSQGPGWWLASDGKWYPPELWTGPPEANPAGPTTPTSSSSQPSAATGLPRSGTGLWHRHSGPIWTAGYGATPYANAGYGQYVPAGYRCALWPGRPSQDQWSGDRLASSARVLVSSCSDPGRVGRHLRLCRPPPDPAVERCAGRRRAGPGGHHRRFRRGRPGRPRSSSSVPHSTIRAPPSSTSSASSPESGPASSPASDKSPTRGVTQCKVCSTASSPSVGRPRTSSNH